MAIPEPTIESGGLSRSVLLPASTSLLVIVGSLMTWSTTSGGGRSLSVSGIDAGHGKITLAGGFAVAVLVAWLGYRQVAPKVVAAIGSLVALGTFGTALYDTIRTLTDSSGRLVNVHVGAGLWLTDIAALALTYLMVRASLRALTDGVAFTPLLNPVEVVSTPATPSKSTLDVAARAVRRLPTQRSAVDESAKVDS
jgi:hypothetical protein